jgi:hypothetical protein
MEKMFKYKMVDNNKCIRCAEVETYKHLLWECREAQKIWEIFNNFASQSNDQKERILNYKDVFEIGNKASLNKIKIRIIQGMIQMERPKNWTMDNIIKLANEINRIEIFNTKKKEMGSL